MFEIPLVAAQLISLSEATVYVVVINELTIIVVVLLAVLNGVPFESDPLHGPLPVKLKLSGTGVPGQTCVPPDMVAEGLLKRSVTTLWLNVDAQGVLVAETR